MLRNAQRRDGRVTRDREVTAVEEECRDVLFDVAGPVATLVLNRPEKLNAVTPRMTDAVRGHADRINSGSDVRVVVLAGAGEKAFCAGSDIGELSAYDTAWEFRGRPDYCDAVRSIRKPVIAAVNGYAYGGGLELAMSADIRLASRNAMFAAPEIKLGWIGGGGVSAFLAHSAGPSNAALMLYTGDPVDAATALSWGLVSQVHEPRDLLPAARELAGRIAQRPPIAAQTAKLNLRAAHSMPLENAIQYERDLQTICFATEDAAEGRSAFTQRRPPRFHGR
jgi:enoyl-CoA hydratase/carnithine racemase